MRIRRRGYESDIARAVEDCCRRDSTSSHGERGRFVRLWQHRSAGGGRQSETDLGHECIEWDQYRLLRRLDNAEFRTQELTAPQRVAGEPSPPVARAARGGAVVASDPGA